jgi:hypothetical protein
MSLSYLQGYATHHPIVHHPLKAHYDSNIDEPQLSNQDATTDRKRTHLATSPNMHDVWGEGEGMHA